MPVPDRTDVLGGGPFGLIVSTREGSLPTTPHVTPYPGLCRPRAGRGKSRMRCQAAPLPGMIHPGSRDPSHRSARGLPVRHRRPGWPGGRGVFLPPFLGRSVKSIPALRALPPTALQGGGIGRSSVECGRHPESISSILGGVQYPGYPGAAAWLGSSAGEGGGSLTLRRGQCTKFARATNPGQSPS